MKEAAGPGSGISACCGRASTRARGGGGGCARTRACATAEPRRRCPFGTEDGLEAARPPQRRIGGEADTGEAARSCSDSVRGRGVDPAGTVPSAGPGAIHDCSGSPSSRR